MVAVGLTAASIITLENETAPKKEGEKRAIEQPLHETLSVEEEDDRHNFALAKDGAKVAATIPESQCSSCFRSAVYE